MFKNYGIYALVVAIAGLFIPSGYYLTIVSAFLALFGYKNEIKYSLLSVVVNYINIHYFSPVLLLSISARYNDWLTVSEFVGILSFIQLIPLMFFGFIFFKEINNQEDKDNKKEVE